MEEASKNSKVNKSDGVLDSSAVSSLKEALDRLVSFYEELIKILEEEKKFLVYVEIDKLIENNKNKEVLLYRIKSMDRERQRWASRLALPLGLSEGEVRLLQIADRLEEFDFGPIARALRDYHQQLNNKINYTIELNRENEMYAESALRALDGALKEIQQTVAGKPVYGNKGTMAGRIDTQAGSFVSKEA